MKSHHIKIMNDDGTYSFKTTDQIPSKPSEQYCQASYKLIKALNNLKNNPNTNVVKATNRFSKNFSVLAHLNQGYVNRIINHYLLTAHQVTFHDRFTYLFQLCSSVKLNMTKIKNIAKDYHHEKLVNQRRNCMRAKINELRMDREMDPDLFFNSYEHIRCGHLIHKLNTGRSYHTPHKNAFSQTSKRTELANLGNQKRYRFIGTFIRSGFKSTFHGNGLRTGNRYAPTLLFKNVLFNNQGHYRVVTDHLWLNYTKGFRKLGQFKLGDRIAFNARVHSYLKGYGPIVDKTVDYDLSFPTKIKRVNQSVKRISMPIDNKNALLGYVMKKNKDFYLANDRPYNDWYVA